MTLSKKTQFSTIPRKPNFLDSFSMYTEICFDLKNDHLVLNDFFQDYLFYKYSILSEDFIEKYFDKIHIYSLCKYQKLSEDFIEKYKDKLNWEGLCVNYKLTFSEEFAFKHFEYFDWSIFPSSSLSNFSEESIEKLITLGVDNRTFWQDVAGLCAISNKFIQKYFDKIAINDLIWNNKVDSIFVEKLELLYSK